MYTQGIKVRIEEVIYLSPPTAKIKSQLNVAKTKEEFILQHGITKTMNKTIHTQLAVG